MPSPKPNRNDRGKRPAGYEDWVEVSGDLEWQEDLAEESPYAGPGQSEASGDKKLRSTSVISLLKEFFLKVASTNSSGVGRRAGGPGAGNQNRV